MAAEKNFEKKVKDFLTEKGCWFIKYWGGGGFTKSGIPDLLVCMDGFFMAVELKAPNGKPSELQIYQLKKIMKSFGIAILLYPKDFEQFKEYVTRIMDGEIHENLIDSYPFLTEWMDKYITKGD